MGTLNVRRLDDDVLRRLKLRAAENNRSLEGEARHILEQAVLSAPGLSDRRRSFIELAARLRSETEGTYQTPGALLIREDRDSDYQPS